VTMAKILDRCGLADVSELEHPEVREIIRELERVQESFLAKESLFRNPNYQWPRDALHNFSRIWEYPYAYHHLLQAFPRLEPRTISVADLGSGVTFFPFALARKGFSVVCIDNDATQQPDLEAASRVVDTAPGQVSFRLTDGNRIPAEDGAFNALYCISVLEHVPRNDLLLKEVARVLKPNGLLILTIDLDLRGDKELNPAERDRLWTCLGEDFELAFPEKTIHPRNLLHTLSGPHAFTEENTRELRLRRVADALSSVLRSRTLAALPTAAEVLRKALMDEVSGKPEPFLPPYRVTVEGIVARRRG
jgi:2-polyprenyl-3-methyl-5-hydroxy-6-metoxy-1,4-benzoquinol methylase